MIKKYVGNKKYIHGLAFVKIWLILGVLLLSLSTPNTSAKPPQAEEEKECISYAYSKSMRHYFLINDDSLLFGKNVSVVHNCESLEVKINGNSTFYDESGLFTMSFPAGTYNLSFSNNENYSKNYSNVEFLEDRLNWEFEYYQWDSRNDLTIDEYISLTASQAKENWASILSIVIVFSLVTMVYWNLINSYIDRNFCEEVKN